jgi:hypothetical protein
LLYICRHTTRTRRYVLATPARAARALFLPLAAVVEADTATCGGDPALGHVRCVRVWPAARTAHATWQLAHRARTRDDAT